MKNIILFFLFTAIVTAQIKPNTGIFLDSKNHWYVFTNNSNIISPVIKQPHYEEKEYVKIADNILIYQRDNGGWMKNYDMTAILTQSQIDTLVATKNSINTTFDNGTTYSQVRYLAEVYSITKNVKYKTACLNGLEFILSAQYQNGGWMQHFPVENNYKRYITFNDGAFIGILNLFKDVLEGNPVFSFLDSNIKGRIHVAYDKGLNRLLNLQITDNGKLTVWSQQYDEITMKPIWGRSYEMPALTNYESSDIVEFLMSIKNPNEKVIKAIENAVTWFDKSKIVGIKVENFDAPEIMTKYKTKPITTDCKVVPSNSPLPIWSRFNEFQTNNPIFSNRGNELVYSLSDVDRERRVGYRWYTSKPLRVLKKYEIWRKKWTPRTK